jgi:hypothetical protein
VSTSSSLDFHCEMSLPRAKDKIGQDDAYGGSGDHGLTHQRVQQPPLTCSLEAVVRERTLTRTADLRGMEGMHACMHACMKGGGGRWGCHT